MSGTSTDALDLCWVQSSELLSQSIPQFERASVPYSPEWKFRIEKAHELNGLDLMLLHRDYAEWVAETVRKLQNKNGLIAEAIGFHGPTVFHQPQRKLSLQLGSPEVLSRMLGIPVVADFRTPDLELGGRGAPLVPFGDRFLFGEYDACLNLGGFANGSEEIDGARVASDLCACNYVLDRLARMKGLAYDDRGTLAASGERIHSWVERWNALPFLQKQTPIALSREDIESHLEDVLQLDDIENALHSYGVHIAQMCARRIQSRGRILVTGGGTYNDFLIEQLRKAMAPAEIVVPSTALIEGKEALIFALLAHQKLRGEVNVLSSATGACEDHSTGWIYHSKP